MRMFSLNVANELYYYPTLLYYFISDILFPIFVNKQLIIEDNYKMLNQLKKGCKSYHFYVLYAN